MKLWGGRFTKSTEKMVDSFGASVSFDKRLYKEDIAGSIAHVRMLARCNILASEEAEEIVSGLKGILDDIEKGKVEFSPEAEDVHMNVEKWLSGRIGPVAGKLHTARSRNDQVALDVRMHLKGEIKRIAGLILELQRTILKIADENIDVIMPGYSHLQRAQPILFSHHIMAYFWMLARDVERLEGCYSRTDVMPLGAGALAGTPFPIDRISVACELGFSRVSENSLDAVSDRDFAIEFIACASILMMHLSRLCEEVVIWSTLEFGFLELDDAYATGSSMMPQKKNPDVAELVRGKTGRVYGDLVALLTVMKGLPLSYNKDMQEDKEPLFDALDTVTSCLSVAGPMLGTLRLRRDRMIEATREGFLVATDVADYLVKKGIPFREAHEVVGRIVLYCLEQGKAFADLRMEEWRSFSDKFEEDVARAIAIASSIAARDVPGGTAPGRVRDAIEQGRAWVSSTSQGLAGGWGRTGGKR